MFKNQSMETFMQRSNPPAFICRQLAARLAVSEFKVWNIVAFYLTFLISHL